MQDEKTKDRTDLEEGTILIDCSDCHNQFPFTPGEQEFFAQRGLHPPRRCGVCRAKRKAKFESTNG